MTRESAAVALVAVAWVDGQAEQPGVRVVGPRHTERVADELRAVGIAPAEDTDEMLPMLMLIRELVR